MDVEGLLPPTPPLQNKYGDNAAYGTKAWRRRPAFLQSFEASTSQASGTALPHWQQHLPCLRLVAPPAANHQPPSLASIPCAPQRANLLAAKTKLPKIFLTDDFTVPVPYENNVTYGDILHSDATLAQVGPRGSVRRQAGTLEGGRNTGHIWAVSARLASPSRALACTCAALYCTAAGQAGHLRPGALEEHPRGLQEGRHPRGLQRE